MDKLWEATLDPKSPRYVIWKHILESETVPIKNPAPFDAKLGESEQDEVYALDVPKLTQPQYLRLRAFVIKKFHCAEQDAENELLQRGFPIRSSDVIVAFSMRAFL
jgi:hypothetical protein